MKLNQYRHKSIYVYILRNKIKVLDHEHFGSAPVVVPQYYMLPCDYLIVENWQKSAAMSVSWNMYNGLTHTLHVGFEL